MKIFKKLASVLLVAVLALSMGSTAWAADIVISNSATGHTYSAYQIFTGDLSSDTLSNVQWGSGVSATAQTALGTAADKAATLTDSADAREFAALLVDTDGYLGTAAKTVTAPSNGQYTLSELAAGYYLVTDETTSGAVSAYIVQIVGENDTITVAPKTGVPTFEKKVQDINDSDATPTLTELQDSADYDIGDAVPFTLTVTLPSEASGYSSFEHYYLAFEDTMSTGLTFNSDSIKIYLNTVDEANRLAAKADIDSNDNYSLSVESNNNGFKLAIIDLKELTQVSAGDKIIVTYTATLNENAVVGAPGNDNTASIVYSNNPNYDGYIAPGEYGQNDKTDFDGDGNPDDEDDDDDGDGTPDTTDIDLDNDGIDNDKDLDDDNDGIPDTEEKDTDNDGTPDDQDPDDDGDGTPDATDTDDDGDGTSDAEDTDDDPSVVDESPEDTVTVFTFEVVIDKIDNTNAALDGAAFALYKYDADGTGATPADKNVTGYANYYLVKEITTGTTFTFSGLDDGKYVLIETVTPDTYNTISPIAFTVASEHETNSSDPALTSLTVTVTSGSGSFTAATSNTTVTKLDNTTKNLTSGQIYTEIVNKAGTTLPETGGVGTTIFYIVGAILVIGAGVLLITKKRMENK